MIKIVVDSNIIFSAMLNLNSRIGQMLINGKYHFDFYSPEYAKYEIFKHKEKIKKIAQLNEEQFIETYSLISKNITTLNHSIVPIETYKNAETICKSIDKDDTIFVAFSNFTKGLLWTGDLKLITGLKDQNFVSTIQTEELYNMFLKKGRLQ